MPQVLVGIGQLAFSPDDGVGIAIFDEGFPTPFVVVSTSLVVSPFDFGGAQVAQREAGHAMIAKRFPVLDAVLPKNDSFFSTRGLAGDIGEIES